MGGIDTPESAEPKRAREEHKRVTPAAAEGGKTLRRNLMVMWNAAAADQSLAFAQTYHQLASRAHALLALPLATMARSPLGAALARIGTL